MLFYCVEPLHKNVAEKKQDYYDWTFTHKKGFGHRVAFPHVDSCLGVVCRLADGSVFTGHINGFFQNDYSPASHNLAFDAMVGEIDHRTVAKAVVFGDVQNWRALVRIPQKLGCQHISYLMTDQSKYPNGVDVLFDVDSGKVNLEKYKDGRDFRPGLAVSHAVDLDAANGIQDVSCNQ